MRYLVVSMRKLVLMALVAIANVAAAPAGTAQTITLTGTSQLSTTFNCFVSRAAETTRRQSSSAEPDAGPRRVFAGVCPAGPRSLQ